METNTTPEGEMMTTMERPAPVLAGPEQTQAIMALCEVTVQMLDQGFTPQETMNALAVMMAKLALAGGIRIGAGHQRAIVLRTVGEIFEYCARRPDAFGFEFGAGEPSALIGA